MYAEAGFFGGWLPLTRSFIFYIAFENSLSENGFSAPFKILGDPMAALS